MRPLPPTVRPARVASVQKSSEGASATVITRHGSRPGDTSFLQRYQDWQQTARRYARQIGVVQFTAGVTSNVCSRCILRVEERDDRGDWKETADAAFGGLFDRYQNPRQETPELVSLHAWHYSITGEGVQVMRDGPGGVEWGIFSTAVVDWDRPEKGSATVKLTPDGKTANDTAFVVPREQVIRFWIPDQEYQAFATSPMAASIADLRRYKTLARRAESEAESQLAMNGLVWVANEALTVEDGDDDDVDDAATPQSPFERQYYEVAKLRMDEATDDVAAIAPPLFHNDHEFGEPKFVKMGNPLDPSGIAYRREALEDYARGSDLPSAMVVGGGPGEMNHWTEWLVDQKFFDAGVAPTMNRITHTDLTNTFLVPLLVMSGRDPNRYRVGYDPGPVIVKADQSKSALEFYLAGLLKGDVALRAANFDPDDRMDSVELAVLLDVLSKQQPAMPGQEGVTPGPPSNGVAPPPPAANGRAPVAVASLLASVLADAERH